MSATSGAELPIRPSINTSMRGTLGRGLYGEAKKPADSMASGLFRLYYRTPLACEKHAKWRTTGGQKKA
jgi:hypothetical protein